MELNERLDKIEKTLADLQGLLSTLFPMAQEAKAVVKPVVETHHPPPPSPPPPPPKPEPPVSHRPPFKSEPMNPAKLEALDALKRQNKQKLQSHLNPSVQPAKTLPPVSINHALQPAVNEFETLKNLLNSKEWPHAVDPTLICDITSDQDKEDRAEGILDLIIDVHLENLKFLDFGCGEGHVVNRSKTQKPKMSVGFDIKKSDKWEGWDKAPNMVFTDDWEETKRFGPFNIVLMYDVIDHMIQNEQELIAKLKQIKQVLAINGKVYVRAHPWCSRHGTHLYHQINKAFVHMVFTDEELNKMGYKQEEVRKVMTPLAIYARIFQASGFKIQSGPHQIKEGVEPFFINNPLIAGRIKSQYKDCEREDLKQGKFPTGPMENQFIDYILM